MTAPPEEQTAPPPGRSARLLDVLLRVAGGVVALSAGALVAVLELILAVAAWEQVKARPSTSGEVLVGVASGVAGLVLVVGATVALSWFAHAAVGTRWAALLPALPWFVLMAVAAVRTREGDLLLGGDNLLGLGLILAGAVTFAVMLFRQLLAPVAAVRG
ncbi:hypothetical protein K7640_21470 [Micromonospora sp. PLK6-60]|uniref:hypothetical protein n=1 Tax=Micromonospora sp. PLK6-60 TaxID=2873383 RepID=UPI001CA6BCE8|nr:hypothetical protein [Micromonospora sp. PLK6-60]MBY8874404.1 hypothetical protein [Micromonospora sp. PLK6-60]